MGSKTIRFSRDEMAFLKRSGIAALYLFGSQADGTAHAFSDYDFGILLKHPQRMSDRKRRNDIYQRLLEIFESKIRRPCNMDIVFLNEAPLQLQFQVIGKGTVLYEGDPITRADYHERIFEAYADFLPYQRMFEQATIARL